MPTSKEIEETINKINSMSRLEMCELWRFAPVGHPYFDRTLPYLEIFEKRFNELGRFSPEISKLLS
jgi:hypothetical protein